jgi:thermitase
MKLNLQKHPARAGLLLISIFGLSVSTGLMAEHSKPDAHQIRQMRPAKDRKPDSESQAPLPGPVPRLSKRSVLVAVIDTGIDMSHPALRANAWVNPGESGLDRKGRDKSTNGIDDDGNGYIDDVGGYDFAEHTGRIRDSHGHGTHIAGIIMKSTPDEMKPRLKLMNLKYFNRNIDGVTALSNSLKAMRYAIQMKADIINYSGGGTVPNPEELAILAEANRRGILIVAAAGNESSNSEKLPFFPANYRLPNILSVTAIDEGRGGAPDEILPTSNFGVRSVAVAAQGKNVESTLPGGRYGQMTGTSQATAFGTSTAALLILQARDEGRETTPEELIERIVVSSTPSEVLRGKTRTGAKLAQSRALRLKSEGSATDRRGFAKALEIELATRAKVTAYGL